MTVAALVGAPALVAAVTWWRTGPLAEQLSASSLLVPELASNLRWQVTLYFAAVALAVAGLAVSVVRRVQRVPTARAFALEVALIVVGLLLWQSARLAEPVSRALWGVGIESQADLPTFVGYWTGRAATVLLGPLAVVTRWRLRPEAHHTVLAILFGAIAFALTAVLLLRDVRP